MASYIKVQTCDRSWPKGCDTQNNKEMLASKPLSAQAITSVSKPPGSTLRFQSLQQSNATGSVAQSPLKMAFKFECLNQFPCENRTQLFDRN